MADHVSRMHVSIYTEGNKVCLTVHDGYRNETHAYLTPDRARDMADTLKAAAMTAAIRGGGGSDF